MSSRSSSRQSSARRKPGPWVEAVWMVTRCSWCWWRRRCRGLLPACGRGREGGTRQNHQKDLTGMPVAGRVRPVGATMGGWSAAATGCATSRSSPACRAATVDRVLNGRAGVSARAVRAVETGVARPGPAGDRGAARRAGPCCVDVVLDAPGRFGTRCARPPRMPCAGAPPGRGARPLPPRARAPTPRPTSHRSTGSAPWAGLNGVVLKAPDDSGRGRGGQGGWPTAASRSSPS